jgi:hypothetical protein
MKGTVDESKNALNVQSETDLFFERKLEAAVDGLEPYYKKCVTNFLHENAKLIVDFINSELQYKNIKVSTKKNNIQAIDKTTK